MTEQLKQSLLEQCRKKCFAVAECTEQIPCDPCRNSCPCHAVTFSDDISSLPQIDIEKCIGCMRCVAACPGQAIFVIDGTYSETEGLVTIPYEFLPLPAEGAVVQLLDREGHGVANGMIHKVRTSKAFDRTALVTLRVPQAYLMEVRAFKEVPNHA